MIQDVVLLESFSLFSGVEDLEHKPFVSNFYYPNNENEFKSLDYEDSKKTRYRYDVMRNKRHIEISYYPNDYFSEIESQRKSEVQQSEQRKNEVTKKQKKLFDEI